MSVYFTDKYNEERIEIEMKESSYKLFIIVLFIDRRKSVKEYRITNKRFMIVYEYGIMG